MLWIIIAFVAGAIFSPFVARLWNVLVKKIDKEVTDIENK